MKTDTNIHRVITAIVALFAMATLAFSQSDDPSKDDNSYGIGIALTGYGLYLGFSKVLTDDISVEIQALSVPGKYCISEDKVMCPDDVGGHMSVQGSYNLTNTYYTYAKYTGQSESFFAREFVEVGLGAKAQWGGFINLGVMYFNYLASSFNIGYAYDF